MRAPFVEMIAKLVGVFCFIFNLSPVKPPGAFLDRYLLSQGPQRSDQTHLKAE